MKITEIYKEYIQKSTAFLYPMLGVKKGSATIPIQNYISWDGYYKPEDKKLICRYQIRDDVEYALFEKTKLLGNILFYDFIDLGDNTGLYVFDFSNYGESFNHFINGDYHLMDEDIKQTAYKFHSQNSLVREYVKSYVYPDTYYALYAKILGADEDMLRKVGRLCSPPDLEKELIKVKIKEHNSI